MMYATVPQECVLHRALRVSVVRSDMYTRPNIEPIVAIVPNKIAAGARFIGSISVEIGIPLCWRRPVRAGLRYASLGRLDALSLHVVTSLRPERYI